MTNTLTPRTTNYQAHWNMPVQDLLPGDIWGENELGPNSVLIETVEPVTEAGPYQGGVRITGHVIRGGKPAKRLDSWRFIPSQSLDILRAGAVRFTVWGR